MTNPSNFAQTNAQDQLLNVPVTTSFVLKKFDARRLVHAVITQYEALGLNDSKIAIALNRRELTRALSEQIWTKEQVAKMRMIKLNPEWHYMKS